VVGFEEEEGDFLGTAGEASVFRRAWLVCEPDSLLGLAGLASTSRNSNTSTSVFGMDERLAEEEEQVSSSPGICFTLVEGEDLGQGGRGPKGASRSVSRLDLNWKGGNRFSRLSELSLVSVIFGRGELASWETGTSHPYLATVFLSSSWNAALVGSGR